MTFQRRLIHNISQNDKNRSQLRKSLTPAEAVLWTNLKKSQLNGKKFRRQHGIGPYIVDFYCPEVRLAVELDGASHTSLLQRELDQKRDDLLSGFNVRVLRFENRLVFENLELVLNTIRTALEPPLAS